MVRERKRADRKRAGLRRINLRAMLTLEEKGGGEGGTEIVFQDLIKIASLPEFIGGPIVFGKKLFSC